MTDLIRASMDEGVLTLTIARADKKNAITQAMYTALAEGVERGASDDSVRVILFAGEGDDFSAGNDIVDFISQGGAQQTGVDPDAPVFRFLKSLAHLDKPAVAAVRGRAIGIGLTLLLNCDLVVVAEDARLSAPFVNLAIAPEAASSLLLPMTVGHQRAFEIFALGEPVDGRTALAWGLANRAVPADQVDAIALDLARKVAERAPQSLKKTKALMRDADRLWALMQREGEAFVSQLSSAEAMEAFAAFTQKRRPDFSKAG